MVSIYLDTAESQYPIPHLDSHLLLHCKPGSLEGKVDLPSRYSPQPSENPSPCVPVTLHESLSGHLKWKPVKPMPH